MTAERIRPMRLYGILDTGYVPPEQWESTFLALADGGVDMIEMRAKEVPLDEQRKLLDLLLPFVGDHMPPLIINDHLELALLHDRLGLHIGQDDIDPREAREQLGPERILGLSTHSPEQADAAEVLGAEVLSYFCVGPIYATPTKAEYRPVGLDLIRHAASGTFTLPWFAIGGIKLHNLAEVLAAGAERVCVVSELLQAEDIPAVGQEYKRVLSGM